LENQLGSFTEDSVKRCPFPLIEQLHAQAPIYKDPVTGFFVVSGYNDIAHVTNHPEIFSNSTTVTFGGGEGKPGYEEVQRLYDEHGWRRMHTLVTADPPTHTRYRSLVDKVFTPSFVKSLEPYVTALCDELIDGFIADGATDLHQNFCIKIPMFIIADQLGMPRDKWQTFKLWSDSAIALINPALQSEEWQRLVKINIEMQQYLAERQKQYLAEPTNKLLSLIANAQIDGNKLSTREFVSLGHQFLVAGNETTTGGIAQAVAMLIRDPKLMATVRADPSRIPAFVEESLRLHAPSPHVYRRVLQDTEVGGVKMPAGTMIMISYLAANYDPKKYSCPQQVDLERPGIKNHFSFGRGIHHCIGNLLARAEIRIALGRLFDRLDEIRFDPAYPEPQIAPVFHIHQLDGLHIAFTPKHKTPPG
jgi:cytochrome P450